MKGVKEVNWRFYEGFQKKGEEKHSGSHTVCCFQVEGQRNFLVNSTNINFTCEKHIREKPMLFSWYSDTENWRHHRWNANAILEEDWRAEKGFLWTGEHLLSTRFQDHAQCLRFEESQTTELEKQTPKYSGAASWLSDNNSSSFFYRALKSAAPVPKPKKGLPGPTLT